MQITDGEKDIQVINLFMGYAARSLKLNPNPSFPPQKIGSFYLWFVCLFVCFPHYRCIFTLLCTTSSVNLVSNFVLKCYGQGWIK